VSPVPADPYDRSLSNVGVIVSGGARGIGGSAVELFARRGARVLIADGLVEDGERTAAACGAGVDFIEHDVRSAASWEAVAGRAREFLGAATALVNCAGIHEQTTPIVEKDEDEYRNVVDVNQVGVFLGMKYIAPLLIENGGGSIVNISSTAGRRGYRGAVAYVASKHAVIGMTKTAAIELGPEGVRVNAVLPGHIETAMTEGMSVPRSQPIRRKAKPDELAELLAYLVSDRSSYATGGEFVLDGGHLTGGG
jgi:3alpha(or 20beta)-hydroxysteroid dehydrogenase